MWGTAWQKTRRSLSPAGQGASSSSGSPPGAAAGLGTSGSSLSCRETLNNMGTGPPVIASVPFATPFPTAPSSSSTHPATVLSLWIPGGRGVGVWRLCGTL